MTKRVLILGGYGNFGSRITGMLAKNPVFQVIIAGRSAEKCRALAGQYPKGALEWCAFDIGEDLEATLKKLSPDIVIHTSGPFQGQGYDVAEACIEAGCDYIDLADGRDFVSGITALDQKAKERGVSVICGASSVPCLTAAIVDHFRPQFQKIEKLDYGITTAQRTNAGLATTIAILGYAGKPHQTLIDGKMKNVYGWQGLAARRYPELGLRFLAHCDIPDLGLFPQRYPDLQTIHFRAGLEVPLLHFGLWMLSWLVSLKFIKSLRPLASLFFKVAPRFDVFGSNRSGFHMEISGLGVDQKPQTKTFYLLTDSGHGPYIPCIPSVLCAQMLADGLLNRKGAFACLDIITLDDYLAAFQGLDIKAIMP